MPRPVPVSLWFLFLFWGSVFFLAPVYLSAQASPQVVSATGSATDFSSPRELDIAAYKQQLLWCATEAEHPEKAASLRNALPDAWTVRVGDTKMEVSTEWLRRDLERIADDPKSSTKTIEVVKKRLSALQHAADELDMQTQDDPKDARVHLEKILARREFRSAKGPSEAQLWFQRVIRWVVEKIFNLLLRMHITRKEGSAFAWTIIVVAFVLLCVWVWRRLDHTKGPSTFVAEGSSLPSDVREWVSEALSAAERGDYREAIHCAYWASVASLEDHHVIKRDRARTPRETLRLLESHPSQKNLLSDLTRHFELVWYGYRPASAEDWLGARNLLEKMGCLKGSTLATASS